MLVVISDVHLNDGTVCTSTEAAAAELFFNEIKDQLVSAGHREDGTYRRVEHVDVLMLGDIFDFIRSERWLDVPAKPWDSVETYAPIVEEVCDAIIEENKEFLSHFSSAKQNGLVVEYPDGTGVCRVNIHYMVGNHDWFPYVESPLLDSVRQKLRDAFGLHQDKFPWKIEEWSEHANEIHDVCVAHRVYAQHGDMYDEFNYHKKLGREKSSLGDAIVIELITKFPIEVVKEIRKKYPDAELSRDFLLALEELDNIRPSTHSVIYLRNLIDKLTDRKFKKIVKKVFVKCSKSVKKTKIFKEVSAVDWITTTKLSVLDIASQITPTFVVRAVTSAIDMLKTKHEKMAAKESYIVSGKCDYVVYGHTHDLKIEGIGGREEEDKTVPKVYINSATWRPVNTEITNGNPEGFPYFSQKTMTWVTFFKDGERKGRPFEVWSGRLGLKSVSQ